MAEWVASEASAGLPERDASGMVGAHTVTLDTVCNILGQAFEDDPVLRWFNDRPGFAPELFRMVLPGYMKKGLTYLDEHHRGAASWLGPHDQVKRPFTLANVLSMTSLCGFRGTFRLAASGWQIGRYHPREPHYYLFAIGALPGCQGQGVGSSLMRHHGIWMLPPPPEIGGSNDVRD